MEQIRMGRVQESLRDGVSHFLAGSFFIVVSSELRNTGTGGASGEYASLIVGVALVVIAFSDVFKAFVVGNRSLYRKVERGRRIALPSLYIISWAALAINVVQLIDQDLVSLSAIAGVFLVAVLAAMIYWTVRMFRKENLWARIPGLMAGALASNALAIVSIVTGTSKWAIITYLGIGIALLTLAMWIYAKKHGQKSAE